jgi:uncharacterized membrane protein (DUF2068 family)
MTMKTQFRQLAALLAVLGIGDLVMVPVMYHANQQHAGTPPMAAIVLGGIIGVLTLVSIPGLAQGRRWALWVALITRILDMVSAVLGVFGGPGTLFVVVGLILLVVSVPTLILLFRLRPARAAATATSA